MKKKIYKRILLIILVVVGINVPVQLFVKADSSNTVTLRILATGDMHGQVTAYDSETNLSLPKEGLSKIATLVNQKKNEVGVNNVLLVDAGDFLYDYTSNFFYDNYKSLTQPIMKAMSLMGYDYITLGNHEYDYPWDYLYNQLKNSELLDNVIVSNTTWHDSGNPVFSPSAIVTKKLTTAKGETVTVKVGIIGSTTINISNRRGDYVNEIDVMNAYDSIVAESNRLKSEKKVDLVVVILHGGIGTATTSKTTENIGYALTKVNSIDAVITGHSHIAFPDINTSYDFGNVNVATGCINKKPVLATASYARALGIIDLNLEVAADGTVKIKNGESKLEYVTSDTLEDSTIKTMFKDYLSIIKGGANPSTYKISNGVIYNNHDTILQDSNLYQLLNNAKIDYGLTYISEYLPNYANVPVIACTRNLLDYNDAFISIKDTFSERKISKILSESAATRSSGYIQMYEISGKNLREWMEYTVSMYATEGTTFQTILQSYASKNKGVSTLLQDAYVYNWRNQYVFDGISYTIDLSKKARYNSDGILINSANKRVTGLNYNGVAVTASQKFILVTDSGNQLFPFIPLERKDSIKTMKDYETGKNITVNYIKKLNKIGSIAVKADHNWFIKASKNYTFLLGVPKTIVSGVSKYDWNKGLALETTSYAFLKGKLPTVSQNTNIVISQGRTEINSTPVPVVISATSKYGIKERKYLSGKITNPFDVSWNSAAIVNSNTFHVSENGVYTIRVKDGKGNLDVDYVTVDRYDATILPTPKLNKFTNRNTAFTGTATPKATIYVAFGENSYTARVADDGTFKMEVKPQKAFAPISTYVETSGRKSALVTASVRKTGPDAVQLNRIGVGDTLVTGTADADTFVYALIWSTVYVGRGQTQAYMKSDFYNLSRKIVETDITIDQSNGSYKVKVPFIKSNMNVYVFSVDRFGATSKAAMLVPSN